MDRRRCLSTWARLCALWAGSAAVPLSDAWAAPASSAPLALAIPLAREAPEGIHPAGFLVSEKFDGVRAVWDGHDLRFRSGLIIAAPRWFMQQLPAIRLDGELWMGRGRFEAVSAAVRRAQPRDEEWREIRYMVFDAPDLPGVFAERQARLAREVSGWRRASLQSVSQHEVADAAALQHWLAAVVAQGGEGLMLRAASSGYPAGRTHELLKLKPLSDAEAMVLAHLPGTGRLEGLMGALKVRSDDGLTFEIGTGFTDAQRRHPPSVGTRITYTYRGRTVTGRPRFASFLRARGADDP